MADKEYIIVVVHFWIWDLYKNYIDFSISYNNNNVQWSRGVDSASPLKMEEVENGNENGRRKNEERKRKASLKCLELCSQDNRQASIIIIKFKFKSNFKVWEIILK